MEGKPGISKANMAVVPLATFFLMFTAADTLQSMNYIVSDADYFHKNKSETARIVSNSSTYSAIIAIPLVLVGGLMYDLLGRRATVCLAFLFGAISTIGVPLVSPSIAGYNVMRVVFNEAAIFLITNPFVNDYVKAQSRGKATAV